MGMHSIEQVKVDARRVGEMRCPECGVDLHGLDISVHADLCLPHGGRPEMRDSDHARRHRLLKQLATAQREE